MVLQYAPIRIIIRDTVAYALLGRLADVAWVAYQSVKHAADSSGAQRRLSFAGHVLNIRSSQHHDGSLEIEIGLGYERLSAKAFPVGSLRDGKVYPKAMNSSL